MPAWGKILECKHGLFIFLCISMRATIFVNNILHNIHLKQILI
jgi:hypothetical protein